MSLPSDHCPAQTTTFSPLAYMDGHLTDLSFQ